MAEPTPCDGHSGIEKCSYSKQDGYDAQTDKRKAISATAQNWKL